MGIGVKFSGADNKIQVPMKDDDSNAKIKSKSAVYIQGEDGATFYPELSEDGVLSWTNNKDLNNPDPVNIKGPKGETGPAGLQGPAGMAGPAGPQGEIGPRGERGEPGAQGQQGEKGKPGYSPVKGIDYWNPEDKLEIYEEVTTETKKYVDSQRLAYEEKIVLEFDGNLTDKEFIQFDVDSGEFLVKVSDEIIDLEKVIQILVTNGDGQVSEAPMERAVVGQEGPLTGMGIVSQESVIPLVIIISEDLEIRDGLWASKGTYFALTNGSDTFYNYYTQKVETSSIKKIDPKFLPEGIGYVEDKVFTYNGIHEGKEVYDLTGLGDTYEGVFLVKADSRPIEDLNEIIELQVFALNMDGIFICPGDVLVKDTSIDIAQLYDFDVIGIPTPKQGVLPTLIAIKKPLVFSEDFIISRGTYFVELIDPSTQEVHMATNRIKLNFINKIDRECLPDDVKNFKEYVDDQRIGYTEKHEDIIISQDAYEGGLLLESLFYISDEFIDFEKSSVESVTVKSSFDGAHAFGENLLTPITAEASYFFGDRILNETEVSVVMVKEIDFVPFVPLVSIKQSLLSIYGETIPKGTYAWENILVDNTKLQPLNIVFKEQVHKVDDKYLPNSSGQEIFSAALEYARGEMNCPMGSYMGVLDQPIDLKGGENYEIILDNRSYNCVCLEVNEDGLSGQILGELFPTGSSAIPFFIVQTSSENGEAELLINDYSVSSKISIRKTNPLIKVDSQAIPKLYTDSVLKSAKDYTDKQRLAYEYSGEMVNLNTATFESTEDLEGLIIHTDAYYRRKLITPSVCPSSELGEFTFIYSDNFSAIIVQAIKLYGDTLGLVIYNPYLTEILPEVYRRNNALVYVFNTTVMSGQMYMPGWYAFNADDNQMRPQEIDINNINIYVNLNPELISKEIKEGNIDSHVAQYVLGNLFENCNLVVYKVTQDNIFDGTSPGMKILIPYEHHSTHNDIDLLNTFMMPNGFVYYYSDTKKLVVKGYSDVTTTVHYPAVKTIDPKFIKLTAEDVGALSVEDANKLVEGYATEDYVNGAIGNVNSSLSQVQNALNGKAPKDHKHSTDTITGVYDTSLYWGNGARKGSIFPLDAAISNLHSANRFAFARPAGIDIEYSNDGGATWLDYGASDRAKAELVSNTIDVFSFYVGKKEEALVTPENKVTTDDKLRITFNAKKMGIYVEIKRLLINVTNASNVSSLVQVQISYSESGEDFETLGSYNVNGWSGWNSIPFGSNKYFGNVHIQRVRLIFSRPEIPESSYKETLCVLNVYCIAPQSWGCASNLAQYNRLYTYDYEQNAIFPAGIKATSFVGNADSATKATNDSNGNNIVATYATKKEVAQQIQTYINEAILGGAW